MEKHKIVIATNYVRPEFSEAIAPYCEIIHQWKEKGRISEDVLVEWVKDAEGILAGAGSPITDRVMAAAPHLKVISVPQAGFNEVDVAAATARKIPVGCTPAVLAETVAELAFAITVCAARDLIPAHQYVLDDKWPKKGYPVPGMDLSRRTLGIIGMGSIGVSYSRRARAFGMTVIYHNRHQRHDDDIRMTQYVSLDELYARSDVILIATPLTDETHHMIDAAAFKKMKNTALVVNIGRGPVIDTDALVDALKNGEIAKAALDVVDPEPMSAQHPLAQLPNALVFPHIGSFTDRTRGDMHAQAARNLLAGLAEKPLESCANSEVNYKE